MSHDKLMERPEFVMEDKSPHREPYKMKIKWGFFMYGFYLHIAAGIYLFTQEKIFSSLLVVLGLFLVVPFGVNVGAHRYFTHRSFKANQKLRMLLLMLHTMGGQQAMFRWVRDHRGHHAYNDTDADPYSSARGVFFSHIGWVFVEKHPDVIRKGKRIDMSDLESDPIIMFQERHFYVLRTIFAFIIPTSLIYFLGGEKCLYDAWNLCCFQYVFQLHVTFLINSFGHFVGSKPYDKTISATDSYFHSFMTRGEGWHNFHHTFPWDYKSSEDIGYFWNNNTAFIDFFAWLGWASDRKTVSAEIVRKRVLRTGDGTRKYSHEESVKELKSCVSDCIEAER